eukprot:COSAG04_NODE_23608_length_335_cov_0.974576_1_plen_74_part_10
MAPAQPVVGAVLLVEQRVLAARPAAAGRREALHALGLWSARGNGEATDQSKEPPSMIAPPMAVPCPPVHLVRDV